MRIKRFNESEVKRMDDGRVGEILNQLGDFVAQLKDRQTSTDSLINELVEYQIPDGKEEDQIDSTINALRIVKRSIDEAIDKVDNAVTSLQSYSDDGRQYLFDENK